MRLNYLLGATALAGTLLLAQPAIGQTTTDAPVPGQTEPSAERGTSVQTQPPVNAEGQEVEDAGDVVVTGSRIRLPNLENLEPTVTIDSAYIESRNLTNVADALNEIPGFRGSVTPNGAQGSFGQGVNFINAFGLGSNRSLTLLNGRRVVSSNVSTIFGNAGPGTQVDLNVIPTILIDRVDRVSIGGAPTYGSDAIASTVNIILKKKFTGLEMRVTSGITEEGDNHRFNISGAYGMDFAGGRGNITFAGSYEEVDGVLTNARDFLRGIGGQLNPSPALAAQLGGAGRTPLNDGRINPNIGFNTGPTDGFPDVVLVRNAGIPQLSTTGVVINNGAVARPLDFNVQFDRTGNLIPYNQGILFAGPITNPASRSSGGDGFIFSDFTQITSDIRRISANVFANFDVTDNINVFAEGLYFNGQGNELIQQQSFNSSLFGGGSGALTFSATDPRLSQQASALLVANGYQTFRVGRINLDLGDATGNSENDLYRAVLGVTGDFQLFGDRSFNFEVAGNYGRNDFNDFAQQINQQNFVNAINNCQVTPAVNATPGFTPTADANCRPLNIFGFNVASPESQAYVIQDTVARSRLEQFVINANVGGSPFNIFGNPVGFNVGYEHREEKARFTPDPFLQAGLGRSVAIAATSGKYNLDEVFGEAIVPLITPNNDFFISSLEVFGKGRYVDNSINGGFFAWSAGGRFALIRDIEFRGNYTKSFRAPAITELFSPQTNTFTTVSDLCTPSARNAGPVPATRAANCAAFLAVFPTATPLVAASATVPGRSGGNVDLDNEEADSFTFGVILRPRFTPGLSIAVDYLDIEISKPIATLTVPQIVSACFDNADFDASDPANGNAFCSLIRRDATGQVPADPANPAVSTAFVNGVGIRFEGIQASLDYQTRLDGLGVPGSVGLGGELFYVRRRIVDNTGIAPARSDGTIGIADPEFQGQARFRYFNENFIFNTNINYTGEQLTSRFNRGPSPNDIREFDEYDDFITIDSSISLLLNERFALTGSVTNLTNRVGQDYFGFIAPASVNDQLGRRYAISARVNF